jgi:hypothetical protein
MLLQNSVHTSVTIDLHLLIKKKKKKKLLNIYPKMPFYYKRIMGFLTIIQHMTLVQLQQQATATYTATIYLAILPLNLKQHKHEQAPRKGERDHGRGGGVEEKCRNPQNESRGSKSRRSGGLQKATQSPTGRSTAP